MGQCLSANPKSEVVTSTKVAEQGKYDPSKVDWKALRETLIEEMKDESYDDGSYGPVLIRLAWHSSGTYDKETKTGGSNGATMRFPVEANDPENAGLEHARNMLEVVKKKHPEVSYADLWIFAAYVFIEESGGPKIEFTSGRVDATDESQAIAPGRLPEAEHGIEEGVDEEGRAKGWENLAAHMRQVFHRMGLSDQEMVALICVGHLYGRCHRDRTGYHGVWVEDPLTFSTEYAGDLIEDEWKHVDGDDLAIPDNVRPSAGKRQYVGATSSEENPKNQMMLISDMVLAWDPELRKHVEVYAEDKDKLRDDFGSAFKKLTELGLETKN